MKRLGLLFAFATAACSGTPSEQHETLSQANKVDGGAPAPVAITADNCLDGQDMNAEDVDVSSCPPLPQYPRPALVGTEQISLGAWEIGTTADGATYKYGGFALADGGDGVVLNYDGGSTAVNEENLVCWAKGYYRLRKILQDPPQEWLALKGAGFQFRFFQFQTDLRNGPTGYRKISSFQDHLVKWVTLITAAGECQQPTLAKFRAYAKSELTRRGLDQDGAPLDAGAPEPAPDSDE